MSERKLTVGSCFSGVGGLELGLEWTGGFETKWQIENDPYASAVLAKHWPDVKRYSDITAVDGGILEPVDLICGGFPCQDVSLAGKRAGLDGKRSTLWGEMYRLVCEVKPRWVLAENVPGLFSSDDGRFFGNILRDLAAIGFDAEWGLLSAAGVGAPHLRRRVFVVANSQGQHGRGRNVREGEASERSEGNDQSDGLRKDVADPNEQQRDGRRDWSCGWEREPQEALRDARLRGGEEAWMSIPEPLLGRVAHGVPSRVDRLRCLGNAVVPQVAQKVGEMILAHENRIPHSS